MFESIKKIKINKIAIIAGLVAISIIGLIVNNIFYLSNFNYEIVVQTENVEVLDQIKELDNVIQVNEEIFRVYIQKTNLELVTSNLNELEIEASNYTIFETISSDSIDNTLINLLIINLILILGFFLSTFYFKFRQNPEGYDYIEISKLFLSIIFSTLTFALIQNGMLSWLSRIYEIDNFDLSSIIISAVTSIFIFGFVISKTRNITLKNISSKVNEFRKSYAGITIFTTLSLIFALQFSLTARFIIPSALILIAILMPIYFSKDLIDLLNLLFQRLAKRSMSLPSKSISKVARKSDKKSHRKRSYQKR